jgi:hypothetical protein
MLIKDNHTILWKINPDSTVSLLIKPQDFGKVIQGIGALIGDHRVVPRHLVDVTRIDFFAEAISFPMFLQDDGSAWIEFKTMEERDTACNLFRSSRRFKEV